jgi:hypothetical protein
MEGRFRKPLEGIFILAWFWLAEKFVKSSSTDNVEPGRT